MALPCLNCGQAAGCNCDLVVEGDLIVLTGDGDEGNPFNLLLGCDTVIAQCFAELGVDVGFTVDGFNLTADGGAGSILTADGEGGSDWDDLVELIFDFTGAVQTWEAPAGVTEIEFEMIGASGGDHANSIGGRGAQVRGTLPVTPGVTYDIDVGGKPTTTAAGWPNGGNGDSAGGGRAGLGGGGSTAIRVQGDPFADSLVVAAGGGGAASSDVAAGTSGGFGAWDTAGGGSWFSYNPSAGQDATYAARGATAIAGGRGGYDSGFGSGPFSQTGANGAAGVGGAAGNTTNGLAYGGGGGGGGWFGGGGAGTVQAPGFFAGGGGGGTSFADPSVTDLDGIDDFNSGHGQLILRYHT